MIREGLEPSTQWLELIITSQSGGPVSIGACINHGARTVLNLTLQNSEFRTRLCRPYSLPSEINKKQDFHPCVSQIVHEMSANVRHDRYRGEERSIEKDCSVYELVHQLGSEFGCLGPETRSHHARESKVSAFHGPVDESQ